MTSTAPSTRSSRRLRRAGSVAAAAAIALSASIGLGIAPASASAPASDHTTVTAPLAAASAGDPSASQLRGLVTRVQFQTHWTPSGSNIRSIRVQSPLVMIGGRSYRDVNACYSMGAYRPGADISPYIQVDLTQSNYQVTGYLGAACNSGTGTSTGGIATYQSRNWMIYNDGPPRSQG
ncbi:hypothetical protein BFL36_12800 [Clavibacter michiganensis]|uniref:Secreted protein n=1 Tax=Clavibacter michiganensis TaxID=28447 RepID=A0A251Y3Q5_9MICO|nr:hypothetical protein [Clavibacter michiganensis]OUE18914.1 hypothetical protein BFL36_12800 [Clavibacter michiganensis]